MTLESLTLEHAPVHCGIHLAFFQDVRNCASLHQQLLARNPEYEYAFIDASVIISRLHLLSAVFKAVTNASSGTLRTPNVHSETVVSLSPSSNIAEAYRRFGISPTTKNLLVVKITTTEGNSIKDAGKAIWAHLEQIVEGTCVPATDDNIARASNIQALRKNYKLNGLNWLDTIGDEVSRKAEMEKLILGGMALRGL